MRVTIIADDLTGALDSGVHFLPAQVEVAVLADAECYQNPENLPCVLSINADTRHDTAQEAYEKVFSLTSAARKAGARCVVKKTDSALRGNVGAELAAAYDAMGVRRLHFLPALPGIGRVTKGGVQLVDGVSVSASSFGRDPFEPVVCSRIDHLVKTQTDIPVCLVAVGEPVPTGFSGIIVYDATTAEDMRSRVQELADMGELDVVAGCAGLTEALSGVLGLGKDDTPEAAPRGGNLLVACGSVSPVSHAQCAYAREAGAAVFPVAGHQKCNQAWTGSPEGAAFVEKVGKSWENSPLTVIDGSRHENLEGLVPEDADVRQTVADSIANILLHVCEQKIYGRVLVTGGDILASFLAQAGVKRLRPASETVGGIVAMEVTLGAGHLVLAAKSGGFGEKELFVDLSRN